MAANQNLNPHVASVAKLDGEGVVRHADGRQSPLAVGMALNLGDVVLTKAGAFAKIQLAAGSVDCGGKKPVRLPLIKRC